MFESVLLTLLFGIIGLVLYVWLTKKDNARESPMPAQNQVDTEAIHSYNEGRKEAETEDVRTEIEAENQEVTEAVQRDKEGRNESVTEKVRIEIEGRNESVTEEVRTVIEAQNQEVTEAVQRDNEGRNETVAEEVRAEIEGCNEAVTEEVRTEIEAQNQAASKAFQRDNEGHNEAVTEDVPTENKANAVLNASNEDSMDSFEEITMTEEMQYEYEQTLGRGGFVALQKKINSQLNDWKNTEIRFAIIGESGSGKSSFINAMLGLSGDDPQAAKVGCNECTTVCEEFQHPQKKTLFFNDLPGVGTPNFPRESYLETVQFQRFHFFILITSCRFKENDLWLAKEILKNKKHFYFVRTKIDADIRSDKRAHPSTHNQDNMIQAIRTITAEHLKTAHMSQTNVFLIDNYDTRRFDFDKLNERFIVDASSHIKKSLIFSISTGSSGIRKEKVAALRSRIKRQALLASIGSLTPIPGVGLACEVAILMTEVTFYKLQLGTDAETMEQLAAKMGISLEALYANTGTTSHILLASKESFLRFCAEIVLSETSETLLKLTIPILGNLVSAVGTFPVCCYTLNRLLNMCNKEAKNVYKAFEQCMVNKTCIKIE
ncbi:interferon-inducible GTPase 1-like isoform X3 [Mya arenaria]|uniref:interferon-inducible GTPase 1-like isoform X3 n=1 Tax=Mya arenaria TaxID=6604 RepID=UPI0022E7E6D4|nr:interferon-inducible GTPase 1-like isoform X3 [Mya arenaria]